MTKTLKSNGQVVSVLKQYRGASNNYKDDNSKVYGDLYRTVDTNGNVRVYCESELN